MRRSRDVIGHAGPTPALERPAFGRKRKPACFDKRPPQGQSPSARPRARPGPIGAVAGQRHQQHRDRQQAQADQKTCGLSTINRGPGLTFSAISAPSNIAVVPEPGMPSVRSGTKEPVQAALLAVSATAILDSAAVRQGQVSIDIPYSAFSMLGNVSDERAFYAIVQDHEFLTG